MKDDEQARFSLPTLFRSRGSESAHELSDVLDSVSAETLSRPCGILAADAD